MCFHQKKELKNKTNKTNKIQHKKAQNTKSNKKCYNNYFLDFDLNVFFESKTVLQQLEVSEVVISDFNKNENRSEQFRKSGGNLVEGIPRYFKLFSSV